MLMARHKDERINLQGAAQLPVLDDGRVKPLDTVARLKLMLISNQQSYRDESDRTQPAIRWLLDVMTSRLPGESQERARKYKVFRIENHDVLSLLALEPRPGFYRYSYEELEGKFDQLEEEVARIQEAHKEDDHLGKYDQKIIELVRHLTVYRELQSLPLKIIPPAPGGDPNDWQTIWAAIKAGREGLHENPEARALGKVLVSYAKNNPQQFNEDLAEYQTLVRQEVPSETRYAILEVFYNNFDPFKWCLALYIGGFLLAALSWLGWREPLRRAAFWLLVLTFGVHTLGLLGRMYLHGRPPVTNLYSSAVFIAWGGVLLGLVLECIFRLGIGTALGAALGFGATMISDHLATQGDTLAMMEPVLDTNFWLATHVTCVTIGYTATLLAGGIAMVYLGIRAVARLVDPKQTTLPVQVGNSPAVDVFRVVSQMMYGIICFAMLFSFTGTVLGGIWADYSWGRFWGWDPKENGALLIVVWNALILHARWGGLVKSEGVARLAVLGNNITFWSWFGTNQLGIGLHSYGRNNTLVDLCFWFWMAECVFLGLEALTLINWRKYLSRPQAGTA
jgi:ABC-type transport system involved in cytochrome c biogenesis permease subunit